MPGGLVERFNILKQVAAVGVLGLLSRLSV